MPVVHRSVIVRVTIAALAGAAVLTWFNVRQQREFRRLIATGDAALAHEQTFAAIEAFSGAIALKHGSMVAYLKRGDTYRHRGEYAAALRDLGDAARLDPTATRPVELLGDVNAAMGRHEQAITEYRRALTLDDGAPRMLYKLGAAEYALERPADAIEPLRKAATIDPNFAESLYLLGACQRALHNTDEAIRSLNRAVTIKPALVAAHEELAGLYTSSGQHREAIEQLEAIAAIEPSRPERAVDVAFALARTGRQDAAIAAVNRAIERYPDEPIVYAALGRLWLDQATPDDDRVALEKALSALRTATADGDASSESLTLYGRALLASGDARSAERILQRATSRALIDPDAYRYLAEAALRIKDHEVARTAAARYAALTQ